MSGEIAYEAYKNALGGHKMLWHREKQKPLHVDKTADNFDHWLRINRRDTLEQYFFGSYEQLSPKIQQGWDAFASNADKTTREAWHVFTVAAELVFLPGGPGYSFEALNKLLQDALNIAKQSVLDNAETPRQNNEAPKII